MLKFTFIIILLSSNVFAQNIDTVDCKEIDSDFTGVCTSYFSNGAIYMRRYYQSGKIIKDHTYSFFDGSVFSEIDLTKLDELTYLDRLYFYSTNKLLRNIEIDNGNGVISELYEDSTYRYFAEMKNGRITESWVFLEKDGPYQDSIHVLHYGRAAQDGEALERKINWTKSELDHLTRIRIRQNEKRDQELISDDEIEYHFETNIPFPVQDTDNLTKRAIRKNEIIEFPDQAPMFKGGIDSLHVWIERNLIYSKDLSIKGEKGTIQVRFIVERDGSITDVYAERYLSKPLGIEAKRIVKSMPNWTPGKCNGKKVRSLVRLHIDIGLD